MNDKIILSIGGILMLGFVVMTDIDQPCLQDGQVMLSPAVTIEAKPFKICFELEADYQVYKEDVLKKLKDKQEFIYEDAVLMLNEEIKRGNVDQQMITDDSSLNQEVQDLIKVNNIVKYPTRL